MDTVFYKFRYVPPWISLSGAPELVFQFPRNVFATLIKMLECSALEGVTGADSHFAKYLGVGHVQFQTGSGQIGLGGCAQVTRVVGDYTHVRFPVRREVYPQTTLSLSIVARYASLIVSYDEAGQFVDQQTIFTTSTRHVLSGHGIGGYILAPFGTWLIEKASTANLESVVGALRAVWKALHAPGEECFTEYCSARNASKGRFIMQCPSHGTGFTMHEGLERDEIVRGLARYDSGNIDTAVQQLTYLAGLGALLGLAE